MKVYIAIIFLLLIAVVAAQTESQSSDVNFTDTNVTEKEIEIAETTFSNSGILPDNPFYFVKKIKERIQLFLTFDDEGKAKLHLEFAKTRVAEAKSLIEKNRTKDAEDLFEDYLEELDEVERISKGIGVNVSSIAKEIEDVLRKSTLVLQLVYEKVPEQAKPAIERALNNSIEKEVRIKIRIENETNEEKIKIVIREEIKRSEEIREKIREKIEERKEKIEERKEEGGIVCIQVITPAKNPETGECKEFSTPCDVPEEWEKVDSCSELKIETTVTTPVV